MLSSTSSLGMKLLVSSKLIFSLYSILLFLTAILAWRLLLFKTITELWRVIGLKKVENSDLEHFLDSQKF